jgi:hypothetical protein
MNVDAHLLNYFSTELQSMDIHDTLIITRVSAADHLLPSSHTFTAQYCNTSEWTSSLLLHNCKLYAREIKANFT